MNNLIDLGSETAKGGFRNEKEIASIVNSHTTNIVGRELLAKMNVGIGDGKKISARIHHGSKSDMVVSIEHDGSIDKIGAQIKMVSNEKGFNQIDKRWIEKYKEIWDMPESVAYALKQFTGEIKPEDMESRDGRRLFANELPEQRRNQILSFIDENRDRICSTVFLGESGIKPEWYIICFNQPEQKSMFVFPINEVIDFYSGKAGVTPRGSFYLGKITIQRKGGDAGRPSANMLQFKIDPMAVVSERST